jgi:hypothetical protein
VQAPIGDRGHVAIAVQPAGLSAPDRGKSLSQPGALNTNHGDVGGGRG